MLCQKAVWWTTVVTLFLAASLVQAAESYEVTLERGARVRMRDGVVLYADIYRPKTARQFPVLPPANP